MYVAMHFDCELYIGIWCTVCLRHNVESGYLAHALIRIIAETYTLNNELRLIARVKFRPRLPTNDAISKKSAPARYRSRFPILANVRTKESYGGVKV